MLGIRHKYALIVFLIAAAIIVVWAPWKTRLKVIHQGGKGPPTLVLLHGYGSSAEQWMPYTQTISFPHQGRFLFPQGPEQALRIDGLPAGHAWWDLDLAAYTRRGKGRIDLSRESPQGLERAAQLVRDRLEAEGNSQAHPFVLGGFSQGAMVSCQIAFTSDEPLAALAILSGTPINEATWLTQLERRKGLLVFISHGRKDTILPFDLAERLKTEMTAAGLKVTFVPFNGDHEIPAEVVIALGNFLSKIKP